MLESFLAGMPRPFVPSSGGSDSLAWQKCGNKAIAAVQGELSLAAQRKTPGSNCWTGVWVGQAAIAGDPNAAAIATACACAQCAFLALNAPRFSHHQEISGLR
jgi:hypothetical protein